MELDFDKSILSRLFIYPMLKLPHSFDYFVHSTYINHEDFGGLLDPHIYIIMKFRLDGANINFEDLERIIQDHIDYVTQYDINKGSYICFVFKIPEIYINDYLIFIDGKYSLLSKDYQQYLSGNNTTSIYYKVFNKDSELRKSWEDKIGEKLDKNAEVLSKPDLLKELFTLDKLKLI